MKENHDVKDIKTMSFDTFYEHFNCKIVSNHDIKTASIRFTASVLLVSITSVYRWVFSMLL